jgi:hypothetical protein
MTKDRKGKFHPPSGKPSGPGRQTEIIVNKTVENQFQLEDKYGIDSDENDIEGIPVRHPNRNGGEEHSGKKK